MIVRPMESTDLIGTAAVHRAAFIRQQHSYDWLSCTFNAFPRMLCFVAEIEGLVVGYIIWSQKSGFRPEVVLELEQIAVYPEQHGQGVGTALIEQTLPMVKAQLEQRGAALKFVLVTTRADNKAQALYRRVLGAEVEATLTDLYSSDEVFMVARNL